MPNKHLEHLEDSIFDGRRVALAAVKEALTCSRVSVKWDGAPAIVFGTNPANGRFFVGTKSVFNKKKVLINYTHEDIDKNHKGNVANILRLCLRHLPRISGIVQADWIGVGGGSVYCPNTLEYRFATPIAQQIILAPHTSYTEVSPTAEATVGVKLQSTNSVRFIDTTDATIGKWSAVKLSTEIVCMIPFCKVAHTAELKKHINKFIRTGDIPSAEMLYITIDAKYKGEVNVYTFKVWDQIFQLKQSLMDNIEVSGSVTPYLDGEPTAHEGFVTQTEHPVKLVDRLTFSKANFKLNG